MGILFEPGPNRLITHLLLKQTNKQTNNCLPSLPFKKYTQVIFFFFCILTPLKCALSNPNLGFHPWSEIKIKCGNLKLNVG